MPAPKRTRRQKGQRAARTVLGPGNYRIMIIALALVIGGFTIMRLENEVDGFLSLYVSPLLIVAGYVGVLVSILWRPRARAEPGAPGETKG